MKKKYITLCISILTLLASCNDITDLKPIDSVTDKTFWRNTDDLRRNAESFYKDLNPSPGVDKDNQSDNCVTTSYNTWLFNEITLPSSAGSAGWEWENIRKLNYFMTHYQTAVGSEQEINKYVGAVRYFRASEYYGKIKKFGNVPWYDRDLATTDTEELYKKQDSRDFVLGKIIEDLEFAIEYLPEKEAADAGELHKDCARTLLSRICLYYGTYKKYHNLDTAPTSTELLQKSVKACEDIMNTGRYDIVRGSNEGASQKPFEGYPLYYSNQFVQEDLTNNAECILPRIYKKDVVMCEVGRQAGSHGTGLTKDFAESYLCKDGKPIANSPLYQGDETIDQEMVNRDPRMYQTIDNIHKPYTVRTDGIQEVNSSSFNPDYSAPNVEGSAAVSGYPCVKYRSGDKDQWEANHTTYDWYIYRYAEVLLNYVEAKYELGQCTQAVLDATINKLRDRVEMPHLTTSPEADLNPINYGYPVDPLLYEIRRERRVELVTEGFRYDDIIRWKAVKLFENPKTFLGIRVTDKVISLYNPNTFGGENGRPLVEYQGKTYLRPYTAKSLDDAGRKWEANDRRFLSPLPLDELTLNPNLDQNPKWTK